MSGRRSVRSCLGAESGLAVLYTALLIPAFLILLAFVVELGALRVTRARLLAAADIAATAATTEQDLEALARDGRYQLAQSAASVARDLLARELEPLAGIFAGAATPAGLADSADVAVLAGDDYDPATARRYGAPTVRIAFSASVRTPLLVLAALRDSTELRIVAAASAR